MKSKIVIHGEYHYYNRTAAALQEADETIEWQKCSTERICIYGTPEPKKVLLKGKLLGENVFWEIDRQLISIYETDTLLCCQKIALDRHEWWLVKLINKIIMETELYQNVADVHFFPTKLQVEHSTICNAKCIMCTHYFTNNYKRSFITSDVIQNVEPILPYLDKLLLHGVGEPFLHPEICRYLELYSYYGVEISCITNMSCMTPELANVIGTYFTRLTISCDGATKETFEGIRRGVSFEKFCNNIRFLHQTCPELQLHFNVVCMRQNLKELPEIIKLAAELGVYAVGFSGLISQEILQNVHDEIRLYPKAAAHYLQEAVRQAEQLGIILLQMPEYVNTLKSERTLQEELKEMEKLPFSPSPELEQQLYTRYRSMDVIKPIIQADLCHYAVPSQYGCNGICDYLVESPFIGVDGQMTTCCIDGIHVIGSLRETDFKTLWNTAVQQKMRGMFYAGNIPKYCVGCMFLKDHTNTQRIVITEKDERFLTHKFSDLLKSSIEQSES